MMMPTTRAAVALLTLLLAAPGLHAIELAVTFDRANTNIVLELKGGAGRWHTIDVSSNLLDWTAVTSRYQENATSTFPMPADRPVRFYRVRDTTTALDEYVSAPDTNYTYSLVKTIPGTAQTTFVLDLTSQAWLTPAEVNRILWKHWLIMVIPTAVTNPHALLFISSGSNPGSVPAGANPTLLDIALNSRTVVAELKMVPNQPLTFAGETSGRSEDSLIAYSWDKYMRTGDERWPARLPMTKAAVRAMDAITSFCASPPGGGKAVTNFVVSGFSKRGWTTWTTASADRRVVAIIPAVIDVLNVEASMVHHYRAYGFWAPAIADYVRMGTMDWFGSPQFKSLMEIEDPYEYRTRLALPKFILNSTGDEFFLPDSSQFYFDDLSGVKYLRYVPNTAHGLNPDAYLTLEGCYQSVVFGTSLPQFSWTLQNSNSLRVVAQTPPSEVKLWQAVNTSARDFRLATIGAAWSSTPLPDLGGGVYVGTVAVPAQGWRAFLIELTFTRPGLAPLKFTTPVYVVPDTLPYRYPTP